MKEIRTEDRVDEAVLPETISPFATNKPCDNSVVEDEYVSKGQHRDFGAPAAKNYRED